RKAAPLAVVFAGEPGGGHDGDEIERTAFQKTEYWPWFVLHVAPECQQRSGHDDDLEHQAHLAVTPEQQTAVVHAQYHQNERTGTEQHEHTADDQQTTVIE